MSDNPNPNMKIPQDIGIPGTKIRLPTWAIMAAVGGVIGWLILGRRAPAPASDGEDASASRAASIEEMRLAENYTAQTEDLKRAFQQDFDQLAEKLNQQPAPAPAAPSSDVLTDEEAELIVLNQAAAKAVYEDDANNKIYKLYFKHRPDFTRVMRDGSAAAVKLARAAGELPAGSGGPVSYNNNFGLEGSPEDWM